MITMVPIAIVHGAGAEEAYLDWMVFTAIVISGVGMNLQATRFGRIGGGQLSLLDNLGCLHIGEYRNTDRDQPRDPRHTSGPEHRR